MRFILFFSLLLLSYDSTAQNPPVLEGASIEERKNELNGRTFIVLVKDGQEIDTIKSTVAGASVESYYIESDTIVSFIINASFMRTYWRYRLFDDIWRHVDLAYVPSFIPTGVPNVSFNKSGNKRVRLNPHESFEIVKDSIIILTSDEYPDGKVIDLERLRKHYRDLFLEKGFSSGDHLKKYRYKDQ